MAKPLCTSNIIDLVVVKHYFSELYSDHSLWVTL